MDNTFDEVALLKKQLEEATKARELIQKDFADRLSEDGQEIARLESQVKGLAAALAEAKDELERYAEDVDCLRRQLEKQEPVLAALRMMASGMAPVTALYAVSGAALCVVVLCMAVSHRLLVQQVSALKELQAHECAGE